MTTQHSDGVSDLIEHTRRAPFERYFRPSGGS
jgi:hypothetical protein